MTMLTASAQLAEKVLRTFNLWRLPVRPLEIAAQEGIVVHSGFFGEGFDARIEYYRSLQGFCIYHAEPGGWRTEGRARFSLAHELGHFYLPAHRERLLKGKVHNSESDFRSRHPAELEADEFAADLLMPMELFQAQLGSFRSGFCTLDDLATLAERLGTSLTSTARRYCEADHEPCTIFFSTSGLMHWGRASQDMQLLGMYFCETNNPPPAGSKTAQLWSHILAGEQTEKIEGRVPAEVWFKWPKADYLWEEAKPLGQNRVITELTPDD
jgi:hypothetical protein